MEARDRLRKVVEDLRDGRRQDLALRPANLDRLWGLSKLLWVSGSNVSCTEKLEAPFGSSEQRAAIARSEQQQSSGAASVPDVPRASRTATPCSSAHMNRVVRIVVRTVVRIVVRIVSIRIRTSSRMSWQRSRKLSSRTNSAANSSFFSAKFIIFKYKNHHF